METLIGQGRAAIDFIIDQDSFQENIVGDLCIKDTEFGPGAVIGTAMLDNKICTVIANDAMAANEKFPVVYAGVIGLEEAYKMALTVYATIKADKDKPIEDKRPLILIVDTPGNGPGKQEEIFGMNKSTGAYQLALAEARKSGHPIVAIVVGRAISGAFLCHGLQADHILSMSPEFGTMIHVMPVSSVARITKLDLDYLTELSKSNPVFAAGPQFFEKLGGINEIINQISDIRPKVIAHVNEVKSLKKQGNNEALGPWGRGCLGEKRGGRTTRPVVIQKMNEQFNAIKNRYLAG